MKLSVLLLFLTSAIVSADERPSVTVAHEAPPRPAATSATQQFEEADISLAVAHYKRLKEKANEVRLKLALKKAAGQLEGHVTGDPKQKILAEHKLKAELSALDHEINILEGMAHDWRSEAETRASKSASTR